MKLVVRILLLICSALLLAVLFVPLWQIDLQAPQYPEGLRMLIYPNGVRGDVEIINGLNHYIGMKTIHNEDFIEFKILPFIIVFFALLSLLVAILKRRALLIFTFVLFILFGVIAMYDFWRWEYDYGHNLDPNAAIIVPGMAYQPPLIGYKQLLNFAAYSLPDIGGWFFIFSGLLMLVGICIEFNIFTKRTKMKNTVLIAFFLSCLSSCSNDQPEPISLNKDLCDNCKMTISNGQFGSEFKTKKGRVYKFDDISCLQNYIQEHKEMEVANIYVHNYLKNGILIPARTSLFIFSSSLNSPMGGNIAAFDSESDARAVADKYHAKLLKWEELNP